MNELNVAQIVGYVGAFAMLLLIACIAAKPLLDAATRELKKIKLWFWIAVAVATVYGGTKPDPPTPPGPTVEGINLKIDGATSTKAWCSWEVLGDMDLTGKRVKVIVWNKKMNGWHTVFEGDAATDTSCEFRGCYVVDDTQVRVMIDDAIAVANIKVEVK